MMLVTLRNDLELKRGSDYFFKAREPLAYLSGEVFNEDDKSKQLLDKNTPPFLIGRAC
jgi:hypothetical protein